MNPPTITNGKLFLTDEKWNQVLETTMQMEEDLSDIYQSLQTTLVLLKKRKKIAHKRSITERIENQTSFDSQTKEENISTQDQTSPNEQKYNKQHKQFAFTQKKEDRYREEVVSQIKRSLSPSKIQTSQLSRFKLGPVLGKGSYSVVHLAMFIIIKINFIFPRDIHTKFLVSLKIIRRQTLQQLRMWPQLYKEIKIQFYLDHPNILKLFGLFCENDNIYLILEYANKGDLFAAMNRQPKQKFREKESSQYVLQVCNAINYMHSKNIIHRDIKPENLLVAEGIVKLCDFGLSSFTKEPRNTFCGTTEYMAPEIAQRQFYNYQVDLWSIAILAYELTTGRSPFEQESMDGILLQIVHSEVKYQQSYSEEFNNFIFVCLKKAPQHRVSISQMMDHPWIKNNHNFTSSKVMERQVSLLI